jgi:hypothetical protein
MRVRHLIARPKIIVEDTGWKTGEIPPRHSCIYPRTVPSRPAWTWRSALARDAEKEYILLCQVNLSKQNWKAWLVHRTEEGGALVSRMETHGNHPGIHVHADCLRGGLEIGPSGINVELRIPALRSRPSRELPGRLDQFWKQALRHYRMDYEKGDLL